MKGNAEKSNHQQANRKQEKNTDNTDITDKNRTKNSFKTFQTLPTSLVLITQFYPCPSVSSVVPLFFVPSVLKVRLFSIFQFKRLNCSDFMKSARQNRDHDIDANRLKRVFPETTPLAGIG